MTGKERELAKGLRSFPAVWKRVQSGKPPKRNIRKTGTQRLPGV